MKKKLLSLLLILCLMLSLSAPALAADARDTNFFKPIDHPDLDFEDMEIEVIDVDFVLREADAVRALAADASNVEKVQEEFINVSANVLKAYTMWALAYYAMSIDIYDQKAASVQQETADILDHILDAISLLTRDILNSACSAALNGIVPPADREYYLSYTGKTQSGFALAKQENELVTQYLQNPGDWKAVFPEMIKVRNETAGKYGYDNYYDYAYRNVYGRDYAPDDLNEFRRAVVQEITPIYDYLEETATNEAWRSTFSKDYTGGTALDLIEPCLADMSDELLESFRYLRNHHLIDDAKTNTKRGGSFTNELPSYHCAYICINPYLRFYDFSTFLHEFGHYNHEYWNPMEWDGTVKSMDIREVHSQALELMAFHYYPALFGEDARALQMYMMYQRLNSIIKPLVIDSLERYIYTTENVSIEDINREYVRLMKEYKLIDEDAQITSSESWADTRQFFTSPCYNISYAVSVAGAWDFWIESQKDFYGAVDKYLQFTALDNYTTYSNSFRRVGMMDPLSKEMIDRLSDALIAFIQGKPYDDTPSVAGFRDVKLSDWFAEAVRFVYDFDLMTGVSGDRFDPNGALTRAQLVTILWRMEAEPTASPASFTDVPEGQWYSEAVAWAQEKNIVTGYRDGSFRPNDKITREQLAAILYRYAGCYDIGYAQEEEYALESSDHASVSDWAYEAMCWMYENGVMNGTGENRITPKDTATRAQTASMLMRLVYVMLDYMGFEDGAVFEAGFAAQAMDRAA